MVKSINKVKTSSSNIKDFKDILIEQIKLLINNSEYNKENYEKYYNDYELLKKNNNIMNKKNSSYKISWPILQKKRDLNKSNRAKFIELLIWYSKIKNIMII